MPSVGIVILNYNGRSYLEEFLPALIDHSQPFEVIVADNASSDDSLDYLQRSFPTTRTIVLSENRGFAGGYNQALSQVETDYYVLVNSDVKVTPGWCEPLIRFLEDHAEYGACQPKILSYDEPHKFEYAGAAGGFIDILGYPFCRGRVFNELEKDSGQYNEPKDIFWASGACMAIRSNLFHALGQFDEDFFAHMEEIDLCWRLQSQGYLVRCLPESVVFHVGGGTLSKSNPKKTYLNFRNNLSVITKNLPLPTLLWVLPLRLGLDVVAAMVFWRTNSFGHFRAVMGAIRDYIFSLPGIIKERKKIKTKSKQRLSQLSVVYEFFIKKNRTFKDLVH